MLARGRCSGKRVSLGDPIFYKTGLGCLALLFWFFGDFRCGALLFMVIHVIYKYKIGKNSC